MSIHLSELHRVMFGITVYCVGHWKRSHDRCNIRA